MAKTKYIPEEHDDDQIQLQGKQYNKEAEIILLFNLKKIIGEKTPLMEEWLDVIPPVFNVGEQYIFDKKYKQVLQEIDGWGEEDLKVKFISDVIELGDMESGNGLVTFFDKMLSATVEGTLLTIKADFVMAKGLLNLMQKPYFHFQEYKPQINPKGEPMAQLLEAFLIAQVKNKDTEMPLYGVETIGRYWRFVIMEGKEYCISPAYDCTNKEHLLTIIAILRKYRWILETRLRK
jgi:hypothetical protein